MFGLSARFWISTLAVGTASHGAMAASAANGIAPALSSAPDSGQGRLCYRAIAAAEAVTHIPDAFLSAIGRVESGRVVAPARTVTPWPWTINAAGVGHFYATKAEAVAAVYQFQAQGVRSLDVGCLQVSLLYHPDAFASVDQAFDPDMNATWAARFLLSLHTQTGSWPRAAAAYHSSTPLLGQSYQQKVLAAWAEPEQPPQAAPPEAAAKPPTTAPIMTANAPAIYAAERGAAPRPTTGYARTLSACALLRSALGGRWRRIGACRCGWLCAGRPCWQVWSKARALPWTRWGRRPQTPSI